MTGGPQSKREELWEVKVFFSAGGHKHISVTVFLITQIVPRVVIQSQSIYTVKTTRIEAVINVIMYVEIPW